MKKLCVIGCGAMAETGHGPALQRYAADHPWELTACCDIDGMRAAQFQQKFGFLRSDTNYHEMLQREQPDAVCVYVPVPLTKQIAIDVVDMGIPVLIEKPPGINHVEAKEIKNAARHRDIPVMVAFNRRYMPLMTALKKRLTDCGEPIRHITYAFHRYNRWDADFATTAIHGIDAVRYLTGADYQALHLQYAPVEQDVCCIHANGGMTNGCGADLHFFPLSGGVFERVTATAKDHVWFLQLPVWESYDCPGILQSFCNGRLEETLSGADLVHTDTLFETNGFYQETTCFLDDPWKADNLDSALQSVLIADAVRDRRQNI